MLELKTIMMTEKGAALEAKIKRRIAALNNKVVFRGLNKKRRVFLDKYLEATKNRRDPTRRMRYFLAGLELIKKVKPNDLVMTKNTHRGLSYEFRGIMRDETVLKIHIRQDLTGKDKKLFLISTFPVKKNEG